MVWHGMAWHGMVWSGLVWSGLVWYGMVWYGMVWYGMVWYGMVWYGMVWYGMVWMVWYSMEETPGFIWGSLWESFFSVCSEPGVSESGCLISRDPQHVGCHCLHALWRQEAGILHIAFPKLQTLLQCPGASAPQLLFVISQTLPCKGRRVLHRGIHGRVGRCTQSVFAASSRDLVLGAKMPTWSLLTGFEATVGQFSILLHYLKGPADLVIDCK